MKRTDKIGVYLKLSCSALLLSGSLVGYGFTKMLLQIQKVHHQMLKILLIVTPSLTKSNKLKMILKI